MMALPMTLSAHNHPKPPHFLYFAPPFIASQRANLDTSKLVHWLTIVPPCRWKIFRERGVVTVSWPVLEFYTHVISPQRLTLDTSNFVRELAMRSLSLVMSECSLSGRGQGHVSNFYTVDWENFATTSRRYTGDIHNSTVVSLFMTPTGQRKQFDRVMVECTCLLHIALL